ncbi:MAG TPA: hypothetical protein V6C85_17180 [Allocoleopsis sp.]
MKAFEQAFNPSTAKPAGRAPAETVAAYFGSNHPDRKNSYPFSGSTGSVT